MSRFELVTPALAGLVVAIGTLTLCGWMFDIPALKTVFPGLISMKANTAICFILAGLSLALQARPQPNLAALRRRLAQALALVVFCIGFLVVCEWTFDWNPGVDQLLFPDAPHGIPLSAPGRMAPSTALNFTLLGLGLFLLDTGTRRNRWPAQYLTLAVIPITLVVFIGYSYGIGRPHRVAPYASVALHTVIGFLLLCAGILLARPRRGVMALATASTPGGIMVRRMFLPGVLVTVLFGGLAVMAQRAGLYELGFDTALLVTVLIALFAGLMWWAARALDRLELERQRGEERLRMAHQAAHIGAFEWNVQTGVNIWTPELEAMYGLNPGQFGRTQPAWEQLVHPQDRAQAVGAVARAFESFQPEEGEWRVVWPDGTVHWLVGRFQVFKDHAGKPLRLTGVNLDITDRKQAEEDLRQSEERFRTMANAIPQLAWIARPDGHVFWYNRRCYEYTGATQEQLEGWGWQSVVDPQQLPAVLEQWRRSIATGQLFDMEVPLRRADGRFRPFLSRVVPLKDNAGRVTRWFGTNTDIAELKEAQEGLSQSEERFRALVMASSDVVYRVSPDWTEMRQVRGRGFVPDTDVPSRAWLQRYIDPEDQPHVMAAINEAIRTKTIFELEHRVRRVDGTIGWTFSRAIPLQDANGEIVEWFGAASDITQRKQAEDALRESAERARIAQQAARWGVFDLSYITGENYWSPEIEALYGLQTGEFEGTYEGWRKRLHPEDRVEAEREMERALEKGEYAQDFRVIWPDGSIHWLFARAKVFRDECGRQVRMLGVNVDISERKQAEEALRQSEERFRTLAENIPQLAWMTNSDGWIFWYNRRWFEYTGTTLEQMQGWGWQAVHHPAHLQRVTERFKRALETAEPWEDTFPLRGANGEYRWFLSRAFPIQDERGKVLRWFGTNTDITDQKQAEEGLRRLKDELEVRVKRRTAELQAVNRELNDFASIVSHDLKAPLRGVAALADWLQQDNASQLDDQGRQRLTQMDRRIARMNRMIEEILQYSRLGRTEENPEPVPLGRLIPVLVQDLAPPPSVHIHIASDLPVVQGEPVRLRQVFQNLISNAIKYANKPSTEIQVTWAQRDSFWQFSVADNGPGIAQEHFERIFKMFQTLASKDKTDSTGVGLALVKRIVELAGGRVWVESRLGQGSTFHFTWPKAPQPPIEAAETPERTERMAA